MILIPVLLSAQEKQDRILHPDHEQEWAVARNHLHRFYGYSGAGLQRMYGTDTYHAFYDSKAEVFAVVADNEYSPYISYPILAYGKGNRMWSGEYTSDQHVISSILNSYDVQLKYMKHKQLQTLSINSVSPEGVKPLLGDIEYGQNGIYNRSFPRMQHDGRDSLCKAGCGAVALAQILTMYRHEVQPSGIVSYSMASGSRHEADLADYKINWGNMQESDTTSLLFAAAASVGSEMSPVSTSSYLRKVRHALITNWGYSSRAEYLQNDDDSTSLIRIYDELDNGRPVILSGSNHMFVCDGYNHDFLHYNFGWEGYCNGWYRTMIVPQMHDGQLPFDAMVAGIMPDGVSKQEYLYKEVTVSKAGTLTQILSDPEKYGLKSLKVSGYINGDDIAVLRKMCGGEDSGSQDKWIGCLESLDLSEANIVSGGVYFTELLDGYVIRPFEAYKDVIGEFMFCECFTLRHISLPRSARIVENFAFLGCRALRTVDFNGTEGKIYPKAFQNCESLETPVKVFGF